MFIRCPLGWRKTGYPGQNGPYYCRVNVCIGLDIAAMN
jgi:hypothetical protein